MASGARAMAPMMLSYLPFGLLLGTAVARCANPWAAWSGTGLIYGGSSHLTLIEMLRTGSGVWAAVGAALLINARLLVYSSSLMPLWRSARLPIRLLAAAVIIDPTWLVASRRAELGGSPTLQRAHFAGAATVLTIGWIAAVTVGMFLRSSGAATAVLGIALPLCLAAILVPHLRMPGGCVAILAAGAVTLGTTAMPSGSSTMLAMASATICGALTSGRSSR
jgi:predicted branched-subunit amino acid permease